MTEDIIRFRYTGGIAANGELNFYELGRAYYAAARLTYTVARFRETGRVLQKITERIETRIVTRPPRPGSFEFDAVAFLQNVVVPAAVSVPITALFAWIWQSINPLEWISKATETDARREIVALARRDAVQLSREETRRLKIFERITKNKDAITDDFISVLKELIDLTRARDPDNAQEIGDLKRRISSLEASRERQALINRFADELSAVKDDARHALEARARQIIPELGLPLRTSAEYFSMGTPANSALFTRLNHAEVLEINSERAGTDLQAVDAEVIRYDREGKYGKVRITRGTRDISIGEYFFRLDTRTRRGLSSDVIDAMHLGPLAAKVYTIKDASGDVKRLLLSDIELP